MNVKAYMDISPEVQEAIMNHKPVVALESTIIFHGMPYPKNIECHQKCEQVIRAKGAVPATTAITNGRIKVGLTKQDIEQMIQQGNVIKVSRRDLAQTVAAGHHGATTVAAGIMIAEMAGIHVFATGGIGGVHRGAEKTFDISADLPQLAQSNVCVVCAGAKSILDIGLTLEYLETWGVPVLGYETHDFPAFYTRKSGFKVDYAMSGAVEVAQMMKAKWEMGIQGGLLVACPVPEAYSMDESAINNAIENALVKAEKAGIHGKESTPFILGQVVAETGGASLETNMNLVWNNCEKAAEIAIAYQNLS